MVDVCPPVSSQGGAGGGRNRGSDAVVYAVTALAALLVVLVVMIVVLVLVLRARKRRRVIARVQSPILKEVSFLKKESELGLISPTSPHPGNPSLGDPLEFPRNRLYIYSNRVLGMLFQSAPVW